MKIVRSGDRVIFVSRGDVPPFELAKAVRSEEMSSGRKLYRYKKLRKQGETEHIYKRRP